MTKLEQMNAICADILHRHEAMAEVELKAAYANLADLVLDREIMELPYAVRNAPFLTASKIKAFARCQFCYRKKYVEQAEDRTEGDKDYFVIGQAVDDFLTLGAEYFGKKYAIMDSRVSDVQEAIEEQERKIVEAQTDVKKDGSRSATGLKAEAKAHERMVFLASLGGKIQITQTMFDTVMQVVNEYTLNEMFNKAPRKRVFFHVLQGFLIKVELDDYIEELNLINDVKTTSSILSATEHNWPEMYLPQAAMYQWVVEENVFEKPRVRLQVVDKNPCFSRSHCWEYTDATLQPERGHLLAVIEKMRIAHDTEYFSAPTDQATLFQCAYYGVEGHGRPTTPILY